MNALSTIKQRMTMGLAVVGVAFLLLVAGKADARFFPVEKLQPGTRGTGKTVLQGTTVESFEVEYIGVMRDAGPSGDLILVRVSGGVIERSGGIAAGMSGSPVYIGDQLVGAIGYGFNMADHRVGLVTPIDDMLDVLNLVPSDSPHTLEVGDSEASATSIAATTGDVGPRGVILADSVAAAQEAMKTTDADTFVFAPVQSPLLASGFGARALDDLGRRLQPFRLQPVRAGTAPGPGVEAGTDELQPGSAFGVQLATGDITLTSIGTVTFIDGERFVGFGHPFTNRGTVDFVASSAYVHDVVHATSMPFKLGSPIGPIGTLVQDRGAAVGARLGATPEMIPVTISVHDADRDKTSLRQFEIVRDHEYTVALATSGALALLDRSVDRLGRGTARIVFRIEGEGLDRPLIRDNLYYSDFDITALSLLEFMEAVSLVVNNRFQPVDITRIHLSAQVEEDRHTAHVEQARPDKAEVSPGDTVEVTVTLRPYRQAPVSQRLELTIPPDAAPGPVTVEVRGGGWGLRPPVAEEDTILDDPEEALGETVADLALLVEQFTRRERNNELVAEFYGPRRRSARGTENEHVGGENGETGWQHTFPGGGWVVTNASTDYVLLGSHVFELHILDLLRNEPSDDNGDGAIHPPRNGGRSQQDPSAPMYQPIVP